MPGDEPTGVRADRWLWAARFYRSRSLAARACEGGKVEVNGRSVKAHKLFRPGDLVTLTLPRGKCQVRVLGLSERRGPASSAQSLYEDLTPPRALEDKGQTERGGIRPTKRDRRRMNRLRGW